MTTEITAAVNEEVASYLKQPYARILFPEVDDTFRGEILEFPGCIATGDTPEEAFDSLEEAAKDWLQAALEAGQNIPEPVESNEYSGRLVLRLPKSLHKKAARLAALDGVSLNQFLVVGIAEHVGERARAQNFVVFDRPIYMNTNVYISHPGMQVSSVNLKNVGGGSIEALNYTTITGLLGQGE
jgi:predicted RNase H-like HicB family nuclease